jgi:hypothetical protein
VIIDFQVRSVVFELTIVGNFSGAREHWQEIIISHTTHLQLLRKIIGSTIIATDVFESICSLAAFRLTGGIEGKPL